MKRTLMILALLLVGAAALMGTSSAFAATVRVVVPTHDIARGDTIGENDLTFATVDGTALMSGVPTKMEEVKGMQARRMLSAGRSSVGPRRCVPDALAETGGLITSQSHPNRRRASSRSASQHASTASVGTVETPRSASSAR